MPRNPIAKALRSKHLQPKRVKAKKGKGSYVRNKDKSDESHHN